MEATSELLGAEVLGLELLHYGTYYLDSEMSSASASLMAIPVSGISTVSVLCAGSGGVSLSSSAIAKAALLSTSTSALACNASPLRAASLNFASSSSIAIIGQKFSAARMAALSASAVDLASGATKHVDFQPHGSSAFSLSHLAFAQTAYEGAGSSQIDFGISEIHPASLNSEGLSKSAIRGIGLADFIDQTNGMPRPAEMRPMARGQRDDDMHVFAQPGMTRAAEERDMVAP